MAKGLEVFFAKRIDSVEVGNFLVALIPHPRVFAQPFGICRKEMGCGKLYMAERSEVVEKTGSRFGCVG